MKLDLRWEQTILGITIQNLVTWGRPGYRDLCSRAIGLYLDSVDSRLEHLYWCFTWLSSVFPCKVKAISFQILPNSLTSYRMAQKSLHARCLTCCLYCKVKSVPSCNSETLIVSWNYHNKCTILSICKYSDSLRLCSRVCLIYLKLQIFASQFYFPKLRNP